MSPGSPDASDELQVIPRRTADGVATPSNRPPSPSGRPPSPSGRPPSGQSTPPSTPPAADPERRKRLGRIVAIALGGCGFILVAAVIAKAMHPREAAPTAGAGGAASASASAGSGSSAPGTSSSSATAASPAPSATQSAAPAAPPAPTTGTVVFDRPAVPGKVWIDGKRITTQSVDIPCGNHKIKIGSGKTKPVMLTCGAELHLTR